MTALRALPAFVILRVMSTAREEVREIVVGVVRLAAVHAMGAEAVPRPSTHQLDEDALRAIEQILRDRSAGPLATRVEKRASAGRKPTAQNFTAAHLTYLRLHAELSEVFKGEADRESRMAALVEVLRSVSPDIDPDEIDRALLLAQHEEESADDVVDEDADPIAWLLDRGGPVVATEKVVSILLDADLLRADVVGRPGRARHLAEWAKELGGTPLDVLVAGRGGAAGNALPLVFLLRDLMGFEDARVRQALSILIPPGQTIVERAPSTVTKVDPDP